eukprot:m.122909 g.122909  ORF g.122909 m.122909 type:complete len:193 (+) comp37805_c0_seq8:29-607(+)
MDSRWDTVVRPQLVRLKQTLNPKPVLDGLYARGLVSRDEWQSISGLRSDGDKVMELLVLVLPRKGPEAYDGFLEVLKDTEGQKYIAEELLKKSQSISGTLCCGVLKEQLIAAQKKIRLLQLSNVELGRERRGEKTISLGLRMKQKVIWQFVVCNLNCNLFRAKNGMGGILLGGKRCYQACLKCVLHMEGWLK